MYDPRLRSTMNAPHPFTGLPMERATFNDAHRPRKYVLPGPLCTGIHVPLERRRLSTVLEGLFLGFFVSMYFFLATLPSGGVGLAAVVPLLLATTSGGALALGMSLLSERGLLGGFFRVLKNPLTRLVAFGGLLFLSAHLLSPEGAASFDFISWMGVWAVALTIASVARLRWLGTLLSNSAVIAQRLRVDPEDFYAGINPQDEPEAMRNAPAWT